MVIAPGELIYYLGMPNSPYVSRDIWNNLEKIKKNLMDQNTASIAYSIVINTILQVQTFSRDESLQEILRKNYDQIKIGSYLIWIRKKSSRG